MKKPGIKRGRGLLGNWQWFSPSTQKMERRKAGGRAGECGKFSQSGLATCKHNRLCSAPQSHLPLSILSPSLPSSFHIQSFIRQKIPIPLVPYFLESPTSSAGKHQKAWKQAKEQTSVGTQMSLLRSVPPGKNLQLAQILPCSPLFLLDMPRPELTFNITILIPGLVGVCGVGEWGIINETSFVMSS